MSSSSSSTFLPPPAPLLRHTRQAAKRQRTQDAQRAQAWERLVLMTRFVKQSYDSLRHNYFFHLDSMEKMEKESKRDIVFVGFASRCKVQLEDVREKETRVAADSVAHAQDKDKVLKWLAAARGTILSMMKTVLPLYIAFAKAADFADDLSNNMLRRAVAASDHFQAIETDDATTLALAKELADVVAPRFKRLAAFESACVDPETLESCSPPRAYFAADCEGMIIPHDVAAMPYKTMVVPPPSADDDEDAGAGPYYKPMRLMQLHGKTDTWHVDAGNPDNWLIHSHWASICAKKPRWIYKLHWGNGDSARLEQFNKAAGRFVFVGTIKRF